MHELSRAPGNRNLRRGVWLARCEAGGRGRTCMYSPRTWHRSAASPNSFPSPQPRLSLPAPIAAGGLGVMPPQRCDLGKVLPPKVIPAPSLSPVFTIFLKLDPFPDQAVPPVRDRVSRGGWLGAGKGCAAHGCGRPGSTGLPGRFATKSTARLRQGEAIALLQLAS